MDNWNYSLYYYNALKKCGKKYYIQNYYQEYFYLPFVYFESTKWKVKIPNRKYDNFNKTPKKTKKPNKTKKKPNKTRGSVFFWKTRGFIQPRFKQMDYPDFLFSNLSYCNSRIAKVMVALFLANGFSPVDTLSYILPLY